MGHLYPSMKATRNSIPGGQIQLWRLGKQTNHTQQKTWSIGPANKLCPSQSSGKHTNYTWLEKKIQLGRLGQQTNYVRRPDWSLGPANKLCPSPRSGKHPNYTRQKNPMDTLVDRLDKMINFYPSMKATTTRSSGQKCLTATRRLVQQVTLRGSNTRQGRCVSYGKIFINTWERKTPTRQPTDNPKQ